MDDTAGKMAQPKNVVNDHESDRFELELNVISC